MEVFKRSKSLKSYFGLPALRVLGPSNHPAEPAQVLAGINLIYGATSTIIFFSTYFTCHVSQRQIGKYVVIIY